MRLAATKLGEGSKPTVLLHGFLGTGKNLRTVALRWGERDPSRVFVLMDLRGHGTSPALTPDTDLRAMARDVIETARAEGLVGPLDLVGHSLGGRVALAAALAAREEVASVTMLDIAPSPIDTATSESHAVLEKVIEAPDSATDRRDLRSFLIDRGLSPSLTDWLMMNVVQEGDVYRWRFDRVALRELHTRVNREDLWEAVEGAQRVPVREVRGARSKYVSDADVQRLQRNGIRVVSLEGAGHFVHVDALDALIDELTRPFP